MKLSCRFILLLILFGMRLMAQPGYTLQHFTNNNGLPVNGVTDIEWDGNTQILWIGTQAGIICFDGQRFISTRGDEGRIQKLFTRTADGLKSIYAISDKRNKYELQNTHSILKGKYTTEELFSPGASRQLPKCIGKTIDIIDHNKDRDFWPSWILPFDDAAEQALIASDTLYFKDGKHIDRILPVGKDAFLFKTGKSYWLLDNNTLYRYNTVNRSVQKIAVKGLPKATQPYQYLSNTNTDYPILWGNGSIYALQPAGEFMTASLLCDHLPSATNISALRVLGTTGSIAMGDVANGLYILKRAPIKALTDITGYDVATPWVASGQALLPYNHILLPNGIVITPKGEFVQKKPINAYYNLFSSGYNVFYNSRDTVYSYNIPTNSITHIPLYDHTSWVVFAETQGQVYALSRSGIYRIENNKAIARYATQVDENTYNTEQNSAAIEFRPGTLAIGRGPVLGFYHTSTNKMDTIRISQDAPIRTLTRLADCVFIGTYGEGIFALKGRAVYKLPLDKQGSLKYTHSIIPDGRGSCYLSTNNGLFKVSVKALLHAADGAEDPVYYHYFGIRDGLATTEFNGGTLSCVLRLRDSTLSFASMNGLALLNPATITAQAPRGLILPDSVIINNKKIDYRNEELRRLPSSIQNIRFNITIPYWGTSQNMYAWYRLRRDDAAAHDTAWMAFDAATEHDFSFTALKPNTYTFEVKILSGFEPEQAHYLHIPFTIKNPWYLQWSGILLWVALWAIAVILLIKWRVRYSVRKAAELEQIVNERTVEINQHKVQLEDQIAQLGEANHLKERLISVISHNIITPLRYIHRTVGSLRDEQRLSAALREKTMSSIKETSQELELLSINLLNWIKMQHQDYTNIHPQHFLMMEVIKNSYKLLLPIARERGITISLTTNDEQPIYQHKDALQVILYNLALNAIVYTTGSNVLIDFFVDGKSGTLSVRDEGPGMTAEKIDELLGTTSNAKPHDELNNQGQGFGYLIVRDLLKVINGNLVIRSTIGSGTEIEIRFIALEE